MADQLPGHHQPPRRRGVGRLTGWISYERYQVVHQKSIEALEDEGLIIRHSVKFREFRSGSAELLRVNIRGAVACRGGVVVEVNEWLRAQRGPGNRYVVRGEVYGYHAYRRGPSIKDVVRYDNAHGDSHRHRFEREGTEVAIDTIPFDAWPDLGDVIREALEIAAEPGT